MFKGIFKGSHLPYNLNLEGQGGKVMVLMKQGESLPARTKREFTSHVIGQKHTDLVFTYGNYAQSIHNVSLLKHVVEIPPSLNDVIRFNVELFVHRDLRLDISLMFHWEKRHTLLKTVDLSSLVLSSPDKLDVYHDIFLQPLNEQEMFSFRVPSYTLCHQCAGKGVVEFVAQCKFCDGTGKKSGTIVDKVLGSDKCTYCNGKGHTTGRLCSSCNGGGYISDFKTLKVEVPPNVKDGTKIRLRGMGKPGFGGLKGDMYLVVHFDSSQGRD